MYLRRRLPRKLIVATVLTTAWRASAWTALIYFLYVAFGHRLLRLPFLPVATIGTAVAFLVGFKNNAAYERFWEGRKIWGGLVNESRSFGAAVRAFLPDKTQAQKRLIYRHLAFINSLRIQLRQKSRFLEGRTEVRPGVSSVTTLTSGATGTLRFRRSSKKERRRI